MPDSHPDSGWRPLSSIRASRLAAEHPDWLLRGAFNRPVNAGFLWNTFTTALDLTLPPAQEYVKEVIHTAVQRWGFSYLKLDFLFAASLPGKRFDPTRTRAQVLRRALEDVRQAAGEEAQLLGCGCPLGPAIGLVDAMRISSDVDVGWTPSYRGQKFFFQAEPHMPSARNALQNVLCRLPLHQRWWINDPDCLLLRPETRPHSRGDPHPGKRHCTERRQPLPLGRPARPAARTPAHRREPAPPDRTGCAHTRLVGSTHAISAAPGSRKQQRDVASAGSGQLAGPGAGDADRSLRIWSRSRRSVPLREFWRGQAGVIANGRFELGSLPVSRNGALRLAPAEPWSTPIPGQRPARFPGSRDKRLGGISAHPPFSACGDRVASAVKSGSACRACRSTSPATERRRSSS